MSFLANFLVDVYAVEWRSEASFRRTINLIQEPAVIFADSPSRIFRHDSTTNLAL
jgi:hypothetical protein